MAQEAATHPDETTDDVEDDSLARALASPVRLRILRLCAFDARTNKELAALLDLNPGTVLHHVRRLVAAGMLEADTPRIGARGAKEIPYRATGRSWDAPHTEGISLVILETMRQQLRTVDPSDIATVWLGLRLSPEHHEELQQRLAALATEFKERGPDPDGEAYSFVAVLHPDLNPRPGHSVP